MARKKVLVCGASGFIGRNLFERLSRKTEFEVYGTYLNNKDLNDQKPHPSLWKVDLTDRHQTQVVTRSFDYIIHAAAKTDGSGAYNAEVSIPANILINANVIEAAHINKVKHLIFLSCTVMYPPSNRPLKENEYDLNSLSPKYSMAARMKVFAEDLCQFYANLGDTKYTAIRHSNIYGPYDKFDLKRGHVLSATIEKVMTSEKEFTIWGPGTETRDFLHINDLTDFVEKTLERQKGRFELFNVGLGKMHSINELVQLILSTSQKNLNFLHDLEKKPIEQAAININKAFELIGWKPQVSLDEGLAKTIAWYKKNINSLLPH
ncbi:MAG: NAD(P)-dependent oxidoreductase [Candidatus Taylorbacteria bacterium]|nr:NAD(P)-dependent oxidoreductase [Candidatus Taylorbacteria bacterium]